MEADLPYPEPADLTGSVRKVEERARFYGTYSNVWLGRMRNGEKVAIKDIIVLAGKSAISMRRKVNRERLLWSTMCHPNVAPLYGYVEDNIFGPFGALISPWYEFGDAGTFFQLNGPILSPARRVDIWRGVVDGIHYLHHFDPPIIHGDIKPGNVLIADNLEPKICDFGLSRIFLEEGHTGLTTTSEHTGTERYLAYELVATDGENPTKASDVWALGCLGMEFIYSILPYANRRNNRGGWITIDITSQVLPAVPAQEFAKGSNDAILWELFQQCWDIKAESRPSTTNIMAGLCALAPEDPVSASIATQASTFTGERSPAHSTAAHESSPVSQELNLVIEELESSIAINRAAIERSAPKVIPRRNGTSRVASPPKHQTRTLPQRKPHLVNGIGESTTLNKPSFSRSSVTSSIQGASWTSWGAGPRRDVAQTRKSNNRTQTTGFTSPFGPPPPYSKSDRHKPGLRQYTFWTPPSEDDINDTGSSSMHQTYSRSNSSTVSTNSTASSYEDSTLHTPPQFPPILTNKALPIPELDIVDPFGDSDDDDGLPELTLPVRRGRIAKHSTTLHPTSINPTNAKDQPANLIQHLSLDSYLSTASAKNYSPLIMAAELSTLNASSPSRNRLSISHHRPSASTTQFRHAFSDHNNADTPSPVVWETHPIEDVHLDDVSTAEPLSDSLSNLPPRNSNLLRKKRNTSNRKSIFSILRAPAVKPVPLPPPKPRV